MKKKLLLFLTILSCFTLDSCGRKVSFDEAKQYSKDNWSEYEVGYSKCIDKTVVEVKKSEGVFAKIYKVGTTTKEMEIEPEYTTFYYTKSVFNNTFTFTISGKKLTVSKFISAKDYLEKEGLSKMATKI